MDKEYIDNALEFMKLTELAGRFLDELSGGQRQRAFVAMVLAQDTKYVLLDEPLNNLDMHHAVDMMRVLRNAARELGKSIVLVVHDLNFASAYSDRIIAMRDGKVMASGTPETMMDTDVLRDVYAMEIPIHVLEGTRVAVYYGAGLH